MPYALLPRTMLNSAWLRKRIQLCGVDAIGRFVNPVTMEVISLLDASNSRAVLIQRWVQNHEANRIDEGPEVSRRSAKVRALYDMHLNSECARIHDYPDWFAPETSRQTFVLRARAYVNYVAKDHAESTDLLTHLSQDQNADEILRGL